MSTFKILLIIVGTLIIIQTIKEPITKKETLADTLENQKKELERIKKLLYSIQTNS